MTNLLSDLFENKKQKLSGLFYIVALIANWGWVKGHNSTSLVCINKGISCESLLTTSLIVTIVFLVIALVLKNKTNHV